MHHEGYEADRELLEPLLQSRPQYASIQIKEHSAGFATLSGTVPTEEDLQHLRAEVIEALGKRFATIRFLYVSVGGPSHDKRPPLGNEHAKRSELTR
jgi:hypothetical protein